MQQAQALQRGRWDAEAGLCRQGWPWARCWLLVQVQVAQANRSWGKGLCEDAVTLESAGTDAGFQERKGHCDQP